MPGTGLGLAITKALVEAHGGRVEVHSPGIDQGSTFSVILPAISKKVEGENTYDVSAGVYEL